MQEVLPEGWSLASQVAGYEFVLTVPFALAEPLSLLNYAVVIPRTATLSAIYCVSEVRQQESRAMIQLVRAHLHEALTLPAFCEMVQKGRKG